MAANVEARTGALPSLSWLAGYGDLLRTLVRREVRVRYKASSLGLVWSLLYPLAMMGVYTLVFSVLWKTAGNIAHYPLFVLVGLAVWGFFQAAVQLGTGSLIANADLIKKVWFPRELVVTAVVLAQTISLAVILAVLIPLDLIVVPETAKTMVLAIPILAGLLCLALGFAWMSSIANVFFRDVEQHRWLIHLLRYGNPVTPYVEGLRAVILQATVPGASLLVYIFVVGPGLALLGLWVVQRFEDRLAIEL